MAPKCKEKTRCRDCSHRHYVLLEPPEEETYSDVDVLPSDTSGCATALRSSQYKSTAVMLVHVHDYSGSWQPMRALVDCASQISATTADCVTLLGLRRRRWTTSISGLAGVPVLDVQGSIDHSIQQLFEVRAWVLPAITGNLHEINCRVTLAIATEISP